MWGNIYFIVFNGDFKFEELFKDYLIFYIFNIYIVKYYFCKVCGIILFYIFCFNLDGVVVIVKCVDLGILVSVEIKIFDG